MAMAFSDTVPFEQQIKPKKNLREIQPRSHQELEHDFKQALGECYVQGNLRVPQESSRSIR